LIVLLPWRTWATREFLDSAPSFPAADLRAITVLIPARNEKAVIATTLSALIAQGHHLAIVLVDDRSTDDTARTAQAAAPSNLRIISGSPPPAGWSGKLWALAQGARHVKTPLTLLMDADIELQPGILPALLRKMEAENLQLLSLMAHPRMVSFWERLFMPAFVYFFKMLYPFHLSNSRFTRVAAAAGGCILLRTQLIKEIGGFQAIHNSLIDDCALAMRVKSRGYRTWIGLTHSVHSLRACDHLSSIWNMVARTAFCQLRYSALWLVLTTILMLLVFAVLPTGLFCSGIPANLISAGALSVMWLSYLPTLKFYGRSRVWAVTLPLTAMLYLAMTWTSALRFWRGSGPQWKDRTYIGRPCGK
ncbi:MAG: glycosyltransferase, partial [Desulfobacterales bacterium]